MEEVDDDRPRRRRARDDDDVDRPRPKKKSSGMIVVLIVLGVCFLLGCGVCGVVGAIFFPAITNVREAAARTQTMNNLKQVGLAAHSFNDANRKLPKAWDASPPGNVFSTPLGQLAPFYEGNFNILINPLDDSFKQPQVPPLNVAGNPWTSISANYYLFGDPKEGSFPGAPVNQAQPMGTPLSVAAIPDGTSNTLIFTTCHAQCGGSQTRTNHEPGRPDSPFVSSASHGNVENWQVPPAPCTATPGKHAQAYNARGILVGLADGSARLITGSNVNNADWNAALRPSDNAFPKFD
jgi:hypothetical protein